MHNHQKLDGDGWWVFITSCGSDSGRMMQPPIWSLSSYPSLIRDVHHPQTDCFWPTAWPTAHSHLCLPKQLGTPKSTGFTNCWTNPLTCSILWNWVGVFSGDLFADICRISLRFKGYPYNRLPSSPSSPGQSFFPSSFGMQQTALSHLRFLRRSISKERLHFALGARGICAGRYHLHRDGNGVFAVDRCLWPNWPGDWVLPKHDNPF